MLSNERTMWAVFEKESCQCCLHYGKLVSIISEGVAWQIYYAHFFSHLTYLSPIWSSAADLRLLVLRVLQNKAIKIIKNYGWRHLSLDLYNSKTLPRL
jgi:hypothetical protein